MLPDWPDYEAENAHYCTIYAIRVSVRRTPVQFARLREQNRMLMPRQPRAWATHIV